MKLLILGGTMFVGRHLLETALARGHEVTLFNRGQHNADLYPEVEKIRGDRNVDLAPLRGRRWDAAIDTSGYLPYHVRAYAKLLSEVVEHYTYISTFNVYPEPIMPGIDEDAPTLSFTPEQAQALEAIKVFDPNSPEARQFRGLYGSFKALSEQVAREVLPGRLLVVRAGLIVGPYDYHDSFTYWVHRIAQGKQVLAPGRPSRPVQFIDARDLAGWIIRLIEARKTGTYNTTGPDYVLTMQGFLEECVNTTGSNARLIWVGSQFLVDEKVVPTYELPMWHPNESAMIGLASINCRRAIADGLTFHALRDTIQDTLEWDASRPPDAERRGLTPERESQLLRAWYNQAW